MDYKIVVVPSFSVSNLACQNLSSAAGYVKFQTLTARGPNGAVPGLRFRVAKIFQKSPGSKSLKLGVNHFPKLNQTKSGRGHDHDHDQTFLMKAASTSSQPPESDQEPFSLETTWESFKGGIDAFYRFSRPHTVKGTILSIISVSLLAIERMSDFSPLFFIGVLQAVLASLFMNVYVVGINQLTDIEIDKVNKPYLPLASGEYSYRTGLLIISSFATMGFALAWIVGSWPLFWALFISFILGSAYSIDLPMLRWKKSGFLAAMCILVYRAIVIQVAFYLHMMTFVFQRPAVFSRPLIFATTFMTFFSVVIALFKDIPDYEGDKNFGIKSYTVQLGVERVFWFCICLLEVAYVLGICIGAVSLNPWSKLVTVLGHSVVALVLWNRAKSIDLRNTAATTAFYMFIWKLFYAEYLLIPLVR